MEISTSQLPLTCFRRSWAARPAGEENIAIKKFSSLEHVGCKYDAKLHPLFHPSGRNGKNVGWVYKHTIQTHWYKRLKPFLKEKVDNLIYSKKGSLLREILSTCDSVMLSLILALPNIGWEYTRTDQIQRSVISQCLCNYAAFIKERKRFLKQLRKSYYNGVSAPKTPRHLSWMNPYIKMCFDLRGTPRGLYIISTMCNTRSFGLPPEEMVKTSIEKFIEVTSKPCKEIKVNTDLLDLLPLRRNTNDSNWTRRSKIVLSTNACYEQSREDGGKFRALQEIDKLQNVKVNLDNGSVEDHKEPMSIGERVFHKCLFLISRNGILPYLEVNLATVKEPGKCRTITSSSIVHATVLQPLSHLMLEFLKGIPELAPGIHRERDSWEGYTSLKGNLDPNVSWVYDSKAFCYDLETATDYGNWSVGSQILNWFCNKFEVPKWYSNLCCQLLFSPRKVIYKNKHLHTTRRGWLMGDPCTKAILTIAQYYCFILGDYPIESTHARFKGDDGFVISTSRDAYLRHYKAIYDLDLQVSEDDHTYGNYVFYGEFAWRIPTNRYALWESVKKTPIEHRYNLPFIDIVRIRLVNQVFKDRDDFSYDPKGKIFLLGKESLWTRYHPTSPEYFAFQLGIFIQYNVLKPKDIIDFLPGYLGGNNMHPPFWQVCNIPPKRGNELKLLYTQLGFELQRIPNIKGIFFLNGNEFPLLGNPDLFKVIRRVKVHHGLESPSFYMKEEPDISEYDKYLVLDRATITHLGFLPYSPEVMKSFCTEKDVYAAVLSQQRYQQFNTGEDPIEEEPAMDVFENKILSQTSYSDDNFIKIFLDIWRTDIKRLRNFNFSKIYKREVIDHIMSSINSLIVDIPVKDVQSSYIATSYKERKVERLQKAIEAKNWDELPQELLSDDEIIKYKVKRILQNALADNKPAQIVIETNDKRMVREILTEYKGYINESKCVVMRQDLKDLYVEGIMVEPLPDYEYVYLQDTGSLRGFEENHFIDGIYIDPSQGHPGFSGAFDSQWIHDTEISELAKKLAR